MTYYDKYLKYKLKYLNLKNSFYQKGGAIPEWWGPFKEKLDRVKNGLNSGFVDEDNFKDYIIGGSAGLAYLLWRIDSEQGDDEYRLLNMIDEPGDVDIILYTNSNVLTNRYFLGRVREQTEPGRSLTFNAEDDDLSIDLITTINTSRNRRLQEKYIFDDGYRVMLWNKIVSSYFDEDNGILDDLLKIEKLKRKQEAIRIVNETLVDDGSAAAGAGNDGTKKYSLEFLKKYKKRSSNNKKRKRYVPEGSLRLAFGSPSPKGRLAFGSPSPEGSRKLTFGS